MFITQAFSVNHIIIACLHYTLGALHVAVFPIIVVLGDVAECIQETILERSIQEHQPARLQDSSRHIPRIRFERISLFLCKYKPLTSYGFFNTNTVRYFDQNGPASIMPARSSLAQPQGFQTCQSRCLDG